MNDIRDLLHAFHDDTLSTTDFTELQQRLRNDPVARRELYNAFQLHATVHEHLLEHGHELTEEHEAKKPTSPSTHWGYWLVSAALAAAVLLAVVFTQQNKHTPQSTNGTRLLAGTVISKAQSFDYTDGTRIQLTESSRCVIGPSNEGKQLQLLSGTLHAIVTPQDQPLLIRTEHGTARVIGTEFTLRTSPHQTLLSVQSGIVQFSSAAGNTEQIHANESASSRGTSVQHLGTTNPITLQTLIGDTLFSTDFSTMPMDDPHYHAAGQACLAPMSRVHESGTLFQLMLSSDERVSLSPQAVIHFTWSSTQATTLRIFFNRKDDKWAYRHQITASKRHTCSIPVSSFFFLPLKNSHGIIPQPTFAPFCEQLRIQSRADCGLIVERVWITTP